jgi:RNA polymerase sigma-70 factor (ECF subfamily)
MEPNSDELGWIEGAQQGDQMAFAQLVEAYKQPIFNLAYRMLGNASEAEDVTQEVFLRAYLKLASYDRTRKFSTWLLAIASNYCIDLLRRRRGAQVNLDDIEFVVESPDAGPEEIAVDNERAAALARAIAALPPAYRLVTVLRYYQDLPYEEIERVTDLPETTVKTRLFRARKMLKDILVKQGAVPWIAETPAS